MRKDWKPNEFWQEVLEDSLEIAKSKGLVGKNTKVSDLTKLYSNYFHIVKATVNTWFFPVIEIPGVGQFVPRARDQIYLLNGMGRGVMGRFYDNWEFKIRVNRIIESYYRNMLWPKILRARKNLKKAKINESKFNFREEKKLGRGTHGLHKDFRKFRTEIIRQREINIEQIDLNYRYCGDQSWLLRSSSSGGNVEGS